MTPARLAAINPLLRRFRWALHIQRDILDSPRAPVAKIASVERFLVGETSYFFLSPDHLFCLQLAMTIGMGGVFCAALYLRDYALG